MNENLQKYYEYLKSVKADVPDTFESFATTLSDENQARTYFDYLKANKFDAPDTFDSFSETLGLKKKGISGEVSATASQGSSIPPSPLESEQTPTIDLNTKVNNLLANSKQLKNPFIQVADETKINPQLKPLPKTQTLGEYLNEKGVEPKQVGLPEDINLGRQLREGEKEGFESLLKAKGINKPPKTSYFWGAGKEVHYAVSSVLRDIDDALTMVATMPGLDVSPFADFARPISKSGVFRDIADVVDERARAITPMPDTEIGRLLSGAIGLEPLFAEMWVTPEIKLGTILGKGIVATRFFNQMAGKGFVNKYAEQVRKDKEPSNKALVEGLKGMGEGALTATVFTTLGYGSSKLGKAVAEATKSGTMGGLTNAMANSAGFTGYTLAEMVMSGQPIDGDKLRQSAELGALLAVPQFAHFAGVRATGNYLTSSPVVEATAKRMRITPTEARDKAFDIREQAKDEPDLQKRASQESVANVIDALADVKVISEEVKKDPSGFIQALEESDLPKEQQEIFRDKINATVAEGESTPAIDKLQTEIDDLKGQTKGIKDNDKIPETLRKEKILPLQEQIKAKEEKIIELNNNKGALSIGNEVFKNKEELFKYLDDVAVDNKGELDKTWFDREIDSWPNEETVKAINEWTENKKTKLKEETKDAISTGKGTEESRQQAQELEQGEEERGVLDKYLIDWTENTLKVRDKFTEEVKADFDMVLQKLKNLDLIKTDCI